MSWILDCDAVGIWFMDTFSVITLTCTAHTGSRLLTQKITSLWKAKKSSLTFIHRKQHSHRINTLPCAVQADWDVPVDFCGHAVVLTCWTAETGGDMGNTKVERQGVCMSGNTAAEKHSHRLVSCCKNPVVRRRFWQWARLRQFTASTWRHKCSSLALAQFSFKHHQDDTMLLSQILWMATGFRV